VSLKENKCFFLLRIKLHTLILGDFFSNSSGRPAGVRRQWKADICFESRFSPPFQKQAQKFETQDQQQGRRFTIANFGDYFLFSGVDVMITIFCVFCQFSAKKLAFFSKTNVMDIWLSDIWPIKSFDCQHLGLPWMSYIWLSYFWPVIYVIHIYIYIYGCCTLGLSYVCLSDFGLVGYLFF
jgi:hypothetical protein